MQQCVAEQKQQCLKYLRHCSRSIFGQNMHVDMKNEQIYHKIIKVMSTVFHTVIKWLSALQGKKIKSLKMQGVCLPKPESMFKLLEV